MNEQAKILICGRDALLLETRALVLQRAGYRVSTTLQPIRGHSELPEAKLLLICHTLSESERRSDLQALAAASSDGKALCLTPHKGSLNSEVATLDSYHGPREMLRVVHRLLTTEQGWGNHE